MPVPDLGVFRCRARCYLRQLQVTQMLVAPQTSPKWCRRRRARARLGCCHRAAPPTPRPWLVYATISWTRKRH
eukprot:g3065.t1